MSSTTEILMMGENAFTLLDLLRKAATHKGLQLLEGASDAISESIAVYTLDDELLAELAEAGIRGNARPDKIFTLSDTNPQKEVPGWSPSNYWNFKLTDAGRENDLQVELAVDFAFNDKSRGFTLTPKTHSTFLSPCDHLPNFRMFRALVESGRCDVPSVAKEIAESADGRAVVTWTEIGLGGIRSIATLFEEFVGRKDAVKQIARRGEVFDPMPNPRLRNPGDEVFVAEIAHAALFETWRGQLEEYRSSLVA